ncbi:MAG: hypothetical protein OXF72_08470 [Gammaproteobacteria bacterium]|nr:hypothetical protein [Gammaproteobacteria bacterium]MCY4198214.1 hypothetical protein [Gammaproteobacteria bacterium]MCY4323574.1 hypothetical protein [Gammaproteobacteria bacterium]
MKQASITLLRRTKWTLQVLVFVLLTLIAAVIAIENTDPIRLRLLGYESAEVGVFWWLLTIFVAGLIVGRLSRMNRMMPRK